MDKFIFGTTVILYFPVDSLEEDQMASRDKLDLRDGAYLSQETPGFGYPSLFTGEINRDGNTSIWKFTQYHLWRYENMKDSIIPLTLYIMRFCVMYVWMRQL